jgi:hypothetical protein
MRDDFPAAHSMDTTWFAVDEDGRVARFDSGEAGAVPLEAANGGGAAEPSFDVFLLDVASVIDRIASLPPGDFEPDEFPRRAALVVEPAAKEEGADYRTPAADAPEIESLDVIVLRASGPRVLVTKKPLEPKELARLAKHPGVKCLLTGDQISELLEEGSNLVRFSHDEKKYDEPGAYRRAESPEHAMRVEDVPEVIRADVGALRLPVKFSEAETLHLADHMKDAQAATYNDTTLRGEPLPVNHAALAKEASVRKRQLLLLFFIMAVLVVVIVLLRRP